MKVIFKTTFLLVLMGLLLSCSSDDYYSYFRDHVHLPSLGLKLKPKNQKLTELETLYITGDYAAIVKKDFSEISSVEEQYLYLRSLYQLKEWAKLDNIIHTQDISYKDRELGSYLSEIALYTLLNTRDTNLATSIFQNITFLEKKYPLDQEKFYSLQDLYAVIVNNPHIAHSIGGFYYFHYIQTKSESSLKKSVLNKNTDALSMISWKQFSSFVPRRQWKQYLSSTQSSNKGVYIKILESLKQNQVLAKYFFERKKYTSTLKYASSNSFYYHASKLVIAKNITNATLQYAYSNLKQMFFYLSYYFYQINDFDNLKQLYKQGYAPSSLRFIIVSGLNRKEYNLVFNILKDTLFKYSSVMPAPEKALALYWMGYIKQKKESYNNARVLYQEAATLYPNYFYGWQSFKSMNKDDFGVVTRGWEQIYLKNKIALKNMVEKINNIELDKNDINLQRGLFFLKIREDLKGRKYIRLFMNAHNNSSLYNFPIAIELYNNQRMDYFYIYILALLNYIQSQVGSYLFFADMLPLLYNRLYEDSIEKASSRYGFDPSLLESLILQESTYNYLAKSWVGAAGLTQLMPYTAKPILETLYKEKIIQNQDILDPTTNIEVGAYYFNWLMNKVYTNFPEEDRLPLAYASYNAGPRRIKKMYNQMLNRENTAHFIEAIDFSESRNYVQKLMLNKDIYAFLYHK